jgi:hypothetical protein
MSQYEVVNWQRIDHRPLRNIGGDLHLVKRVYGQDGQLWPRLSIGVYRQRQGLHIGVSRKRRPGEWWDNHDIPPELVNDVIELLKEAKAELNETK